MAKKTYLNNDLTRLLFDYTTPCFRVTNTQVICVARETDSKGSLRPKNSIRLKASQ